MKPMNEIFDLPIDGSELSYQMAYRIDSDEEEAVAHAINHVDALADALEDLIISCRASGSNILACTYAEAALAAYRGDK